MRDRQGHGDAECAVVETVRALSVCLSLTWAQFGCIFSAFRPSTVWPSTIAVPHLLLLLLWAVEATGVQITGGRGAALPSSPGCVGGCHRKQWLPQCKPLVLLGFRSSFFWCLLFDLLTPVLLVSACCWSLTSDSQVIPSSHHPIFISVPHGLSQLFWKILPSSSSQPLLPDAPNPVCFLPLPLFLILGHIFGAQSPFPCSLGVTCRPMVGSQ